MDDPRGEASPPESTPARERRGSVRTSAGQRLRAGLGGAEGSAPAPSARAAAPATDVSSRVTATKSERPSPAVSARAASTRPAPYRAGGHRPLIRTELPHASLEALPVPGLTRRRLAVLVAGFVAIWLVGVFARQVGAATEAQAKADEMRQNNAAVETQIAGLQREVELAQQSSFIQQTAHGYGLGNPGEVSFVVDPNAAPIPAGYPGSVGIKDAAPKPVRSPLETWLQLLFGSGG